MTFAIVNVLPEPVTPSKVSNWFPSLNPFTSSSIACGWSPVGAKSDTNSKWSMKQILPLIVVCFRLYQIYEQMYRQNPNICSDLIHIRNRRTRREKPPYICDSITMGWMFAWRLTFSPRSKTTDIGRLLSSGTVFGLILFESNCLV